MFVRVFFLLWFFLALAEAANAGPLIAAIGAAITGIQAAIAASPIFGMIFKTVIGLGMSLLQQALNKQKNKPSLVGTTLEIKMGDDQPMTFPVGARAVAGRRKYIGSWGEDGKTPNAYLTDVIEISNLPSNAGPLGMTSLWIGQQKCGVLFDQPHPDGRGYPVQQFIHPNGKRFMWIKYYDGTQTSADPFLMAKFGGHPTRPYTGERIGRGCQYIILTTLIDNDLQLGGSPPDVLVEPHPTPMYDPRKDSTNGGSGNHRYGNWSTYEPTLNPMVIAYNICRGIYYTPNEWVFGGQAIEPVQLPNSAWFAAMNECDRDNGSGVAQYRCGLEVQCDQDPTDVIEALRVACAGRISESGGIIKPLVGAPGAAVYSFDDSGVIVTEEQDFLPFPSLKSTHNGIAGTYPEPNQRWAVTDAPEQRNPDQEAADGGRWLPAAIRFDAVPFTQQVQHLMKTLAAEQRRFRVHMITLPPSAWPLEPNDVVAWTSARNGYTNKKFIITAISGTAGMLLHVTLLEIDPTDYDPPTIYVPAPNGWIGPITVPSQPMTGWAVEPSTIKDAGGIDRRPAIKISCAQELEDVIGVWVQVRLKETGDVVFDSNSNPYASPYSWIISGQWMLANKDYEARGRYLPQSNRPTDWSTWLTVKTPNVLINAADIFDGAIIQSKIADAAVTAAKIMDEAITNLKLADKAVSTAKIEVAAVTADVLASNAVIASKLADGAVTARALAQGAVDATALASGIKAVEVVNVLPTTGNTEGRQVFLTTDGKLYRYHNGAWTAAVAADDVNGTLKNAQIADGAITALKLADAAVTAQKIADGSISASKLAQGAIDQTKLANGLAVVEIVETLPTSGNFEGRQAYLNTDGKLYRYHEGVWTSAVPAVDISGQIDGGQIADYAVSIAKFASGLQPIQVVNTFPANPTPGMVIYRRPQQKLYRYNGTAWVATVPTTDLTGTITSTQISDNSITTPKLMVGAVTADTIAANAITADKVAANAITTGSIAAGAIKAEQIAAGAIVGDKISANAITSDKIAANAITTGAISAGAVKAEQIAANNITAKHLVLADTSNMADNGWQAGNLDGWEVAGLYAYAYSNGEGDASGWYARSTAQWNQFLSRTIAVNPGEQYFLDVWVQNNASAEGASIWLFGYDANNANVYNTFVDGVTSVQNKWVRLKGQATVPAGVVKVRMALYNAHSGVLAAPGIAWSKPVMRRAAGAELIVDGAITAAKIAANAITADKIAANAILAKNIVLQDWENLVPNGQWEDVVSPPTDYYNLQGEAGGTLTWVTDVANAVSGKTYMRLAKPVAGATSVYANGTPVPVGSNATLYWEVFYKTDVATNAGLFVRILWFDGDKQPLQPSDIQGIGYTDLLSNVGGAAVWSAAKGQTLVPGAAKFMVVQFINWVSNTAAKNFDIGRIVIRRANAASLIVDGSISGKLIAAQAITADKMAANSITAGTIAANAVTAGTIAAGAVSAAQIAAGAITADKIAAGSISADKLAVGSGKNLIINSDWSAGTTNWAPEWSNEPNSFSWGMRYDGYAPRGGTIEIYQKNGNQAEYGIGQVNADGSARYVNVVGGRWYEFSGLYYGHRCNGMIAYVQWLTGDLQHIGYGAVGSPTNASQNGFPNWSVGSYQQYFGVGQAPANAALARVFLRMKGTIAGQGDSYLWLYQVYFGEGVANQAAASKWSDGLSTLISGGNIVTGSVTADKIATNAVTAGKIAAGAVTAGTIAAGAVTAATIAGGSITGDKIAANTIGANQIAAGAITAKSLILTDFSNMADNGWQGGNLDGWAIQNLQAFYLDTTSGDAAGYVVQSLAHDCCTSKTIAVTAGETYAFDAWVYNADPNTANILVIQYSGNGAVTYGFVTQTTVKNSWIRLQGRYTIPTGCVKIAMLLQVDKTAGAGNSCYWSKPVMRRATSGELIVDGAITGNKIAANAITAAQIATNAITTDKLILAGVTIDKIAPGAVTAMNAGRVGDLQVIGSGTTINLAAVGIAVDGDSRVMINAMSLGQYGQNNNGKDAQPIGCNIFRNGLAIFSQTYYLGVVQTIVSVSGGGSSGGAGTTTSQSTYTAGLVGVPALYDAPGPGYHVYTFQLYVPPGNNIGWRETNIVATAFKR